MRLSNVKGSVSSPSLQGISTEQSGSTQGLKDKTYHLKRLRIMIPYLPSTATRKAPKVLMVKIITFHLATIAFQGFKLLTQMKLRDGVEAVLRYPRAIPVTEVT
jgi:hypothetical protein